MTYKDGYVSANGYETYYKIFGNNTDKTPLLVLHGGPGSSHNYLLGLAELATDRQVIFYDQLGGGLSDHPTDPAIWGFKLFIDELRAVRKDLRLDKVNLLGHSWGGMLAIEYMLSRPQGIASLILASSMVSMPLYQSEVEYLKLDLPGSICQTMRKHEAAGTTDSDEYKAAMRRYNKRHIYRGKTYPKRFEAPKGTFGSVPYAKLWGASEAYANGELRDWDRLRELGHFSIPTLITSGQYDELTPHQAVLTHDAIPNSQLRIFAASSHLVHIEQSVEYNNAVAAFLRNVDSHY